MGSGIPGRLLGRYEHFRVNDDFYWRANPVFAIAYLPPGEHTFAISASQPYSSGPNDAKIWSEPITFTVIPSDNPSVDTDPVLLAICHVNPEEQKPIPDELCIERYQKGFIVHDFRDVEDAVNFEEWRSQSRKRGMYLRDKLWQVVGENLWMYQSYVIDGIYTGGNSGAPHTPNFEKLSPGKHTISVALPKESNEITFTILSD